MSPRDPDASAAEGSGIFGLRETPKSARVVLIPVPFAATAVDGGASDAPAAILRASHELDLEPAGASIAMLDESPDVRAWDLAARTAASHVLVRGGTHGEPALLAAAETVDLLSAKMTAQVRSTAALFLGRGKIVGTVGGDGSVRLGAIEAHAAHRPGLGVLHIGAHAGLRRAFQGFAFSPASVMDNVLTRVPGVTRLVQVGIRELSTPERSRSAASGGRALNLFDDPLSAAGTERETWTQQCARIVDALPREVYLSFDIDALDPALCPHAGSRLPGGLSFQLATSLIDAVATGGRRLVGFDLTGVTPARDGLGHDEQVAARLLYRLCCAAGASQV